MCSVVGSCAIRSSPQFCVLYCLFSGQTETIRQPSSRDPTCYPSTDAACWAVRFPTHIGHVWLQAGISGQPHGGAIWKLTASLSLTYVLQGNIRKPFKEISIYLFIYWLVGWFGDFLIIHVFFSAMIFTRPDAFMNSLTSPTSYLLAQ